MRQGTERRERRAPGDQADRPRGWPLPPDTELLPLRFGRLIVSRTHAVFCRVPPEDVPDVQAVLGGEIGVSGLSPSLVADLSRHGFFGPPRPPEPSAPSMQIQLTNACNLSCAYCCTNSGCARAKELARGEAIRAAEEARDLLGAGARVGILGGEPFLVPWAAEVAERCETLGFQVTIFSNGLPLAADGGLAERAAALTRKGVQLRLSLGGPNREMCDGLSGFPRYEAVLTAVRAVGRFGGQACVDLMLLPDQVADVARDLPALRRSLPAGTKVTLGLLYVGGREDGAHVFRSRSELESALDRIALEAGERIEAPRRAPVAPRREACGCALGQHIHVRSDGALFGCFRMEEPVGDLATTGLRGALEGLRAGARPASGLVECAACPLNTLCGGGCRSENILLTGAGDRVACGEWRLRVLSELLAEDVVDAVHWPAPHLLAEARARGIDAPGELRPVHPSRHLTDV